jgi:hypothetical protein
LEAELVRGWKDRNDNECEGEWKSKREGEKRKGKILKDFEPF